MFNIQDIYLIGGEMTTLAGRPVLQMPGKPYVVGQTADGTVLLGSKPLVKRALSNRVSKRPGRLARESMALLNTQPRLLIASVPSRRSRAALALPETEPVPRMLNSLLAIVCTKSIYIGLTLE